jgi:chromosome partitioning protein
VRDAFDLVIIDCPPRLTTSSIQAFCASTHLLIPTIFDRPSAEAVVSFCRQTETLKDAGICPHLKYIGVVGTMWQNDRVAQTSTRTFLIDALCDGKLPVSLLPEYTFLPRAAAMVNNADEGIAYLVMPNQASLAPIRNSIGELARFIAGQMGIAQPNPAALPTPSLSTRPVVVA